MQSTDHWNRSATFQQWCGINVIFNYAHEIFSSAGYAVSDVLMNIVVTGITNVIFTFVAIYTVDKWGRRTHDADRFGRISADLPYIGNLLLSGCKRFTHASTGGTCHRLLCYVTCPGSLGGVIRNLPRENTRYGYSHLYFLPLVACFILTYTFPVLNESIGAEGTFWLYGGICLAGFLFIRQNLPETKGKTLEEIEKELIK